MPEDKPHRSRWYISNHPPELPFQGVSTAYQSKESRPLTLFCDLDGVLCDFAHGVKRLFPDLPEASQWQQSDLHVDRGEMWQRIQQDKQGFFENLPWTPKGKRLWQAIRPLKPHILTGVPLHPSSRQEKVNWCARELGVPIQHIDMADWGRQHMPVAGSRPPLFVAGEESNACRVITCWSNNKHHEAHPGAVLIDDRIELKDKWVERGGIFVHHKGDVDETLLDLVQLGILDEDALVEL